MLNALDINENDQNEQEQIDSVQSAMSSDFEVLIQKLSSEIDISNLEFQNDKVASSVQRTLLSYLLKQIPIAIEAYKRKPTQGQALALTNFITQASNLFEQIRSVQNLENQVEYITSEIIEPLIKKFISIVYDSIFYLKNNMKHCSSNEGGDFQPALERELNSMIKAIAQKMETEEAQAVEKLKSYLTEV